MEVTMATWMVAVLGMALIALLGGPQLVAVIHPRARWTIERIRRNTRSHRSDRILRVCDHIGNVAGVRHRRRRLLLRPAGRMSTP